jgi:hypothetical protein
MYSIGQSTPQMRSDHMFPLNQHVSKWRMQANATLSPNLLSGSAIVAGTHRNDSGWLVTRCGSACSEFLHFDSRHIRLLQGDSCSYLLYNAGRLQVLLL